MYVIVTGNVADGHEFIGPFGSVDIASEHAEDADKPWHIIYLTKPQKGDLMLNPDVATSEPGIPKMLMQPQNLGLSVEEAERLVVLVCDDTGYAAPIGTDYWAFVRTKSMSDQMRSVSPSTLVGWIAPSGAIRFAAVHSNQFEGEEIPFEQAAKIVLDYLTYNRSFDYVDVDPPISLDLFSGVVRPGVVAGARKKVSPGEFVARLFDLMKRCCVRGAWKRPDPPQEGAEEQFMFFSDTTEEDDDEWELSCKELSRELGRFIDDDGMSVG